MMRSFEFVGWCILSYAIGGATGAYLASSTVPSTVDPITALTPDATELAAEMRVLGRQEGFNIGYTVAVEECYMIMEGKQHNAAPEYPEEAGVSSRETGETPAKVTEAQVSSRLH